MVNTLLSLSSVSWFSKWSNPRRALCGSPYLIAGQSEIQVAQTSSWHLGWASSSGTEPLPAELILTKDSWCKNWVKFSDTQLMKAESWRIGWHKENTYTFGVRSVNRKIIIAVLRHWAKRFTRVVSFNPHPNYHEAHSFTSFLRWDNWGFQLRDTLKFSLISEI